MEKKSLSQQTADRLYNMIVAERRMEPGEKLPNEVELARELGVSPGEILQDRDGTRILVCRTKGGWEDV